jgi:hypothetical protein
MDIDSDENIMKNDSHYDSYISNNEVNNFKLSKNDRIKNLIKLNYFQK